MRISQGKWNGISSREDLGEQDCRVLDAFESNVSRCNAFYSKYNHHQVALRTKTNSYFGQESPDKQLIISTILEGKSVPGSMFIQCLLVNTLELSSIQTSINFIELYNRVVF